MNIKEKIGQRIMNERKAKGLTRKALAELTSELKISRINNYERGDRTPGPTEIKLLADALEVSASYLMCLTDNREGKMTKSLGMGALIPVLDYKQAIDPASFIQKIKEDVDTKVEFIPVSTAVSDSIGKNAFALQVKDESMVPEFRINDVLIVDPDTNPKPGDFVVALIEGEQEVIVRKYKQLSASKEVRQFELIALNEDWADIRVGFNELQAQVVGRGVSLIRSLRS
ncbi:TPA: helix-turn-helix domain-containing protein [Legionella pneumophila]|uniref:Helix-turn-helix domain-containing protein n=1 Tax=Legionella pneumophila TaxID=446 RepID=A0AAN5SVC3_LEGPN|nr:S24 family peptidase [Legionella pneumophila]MDW9167235.1 S24 family peptidase [Legionella pneumophila subsp. fraseri]AMV15263.1 LexA repressor [Legionella pneumophila]MCH9145105.1 helix-turn-helix domain-containing protein [Legionella pneumophila serogroup 1]MCH9157683.1 helix-turn-helix domain-containing protein [Legionella pneumophila serogroup 1]MCZ4739379.1 helix-turn-helix domain-containing protein [Legionella pneumophila]